MPGRLRQREGQRTRGRVATPVHMEEKRGKPRRHKSRPAQKSPQTGTTLEHPPDV